MENVSESTLNGSCYFFHPILVQMLEDYGEEELIKRIKDLE